MLDDYDFISKYEDALHVEQDGMTNALLVLNAKTGEGILVNSEGSAYARYSAYLPFAKPYLDYEVARIADYCVTEGTGNTTDGVWAISFDEIYEHFDMDIAKNSELANLLVENLEGREEIDSVVLAEDGIDLFCVPSFCLEAEEPEFSLRSLLGFGLKDITFIDRGCDRTVSLVTEISERMITPAGKREWADVLSAKVDRIYVENGKGYVELSNCNMDRLGSFAYIYDGYSNDEGRNEWFINPNEPQSPLSQNHYDVVDQEIFEVAYAKHVLWLNDIPGGKQLDLSGSWLDGVNLSNRKLLNANFSDCVFTNVNMDSAELCFADFSGTFLDRCSMRYTTADEINCRGTTFKESDLSYILLMHGNFANATFYKSDLFNCRISNSCYEGTRFLETSTEDQYIDTDSTMTDEEWTLDTEGQVMQ